MTEAEPADILVVDDTPENLRLLSRALGAAGYRVRAAPGGRFALQMARAEAPDLVLLDIDMPDLNGYQVCDALQADETLRHVPVLFLSALQGPEAKLRAFQSGGRDFVTKPYNVEEVLARVRTHVEMRRLENALQLHNLELERLVAEQVREISDAQIATIVALAKLSESRDDTTGMHVERIGVLSDVVARAMLRLHHPDLLAKPSLVDVIGRAAPLHDVGKVGIPDAILLKPARLTPAEFDVMKTHAAIGEATLQAVIDSYPRNELVRVGAAIAGGHHERWDGRGYPRGLAGDAIPLAARIVSVVDVYDAIRSERPYKPPSPHDVAMTEIRRGRAAQFDPSVVDAFEELEPELDARWLALQ